MTIKKEFELSQEDLIEFASSWVKRAITALIDAPDFQANAKWISEKLNISMDHASESFNWLLQKKFIFKTDFGFRTDTELINIGEHQLTRKQLLDLYLKTRGDLTSKLLPTNTHSVTVFLTDHELMKDFKKKYDELIEATYQAGLTKGSTTVVAIDLAIPRLSSAKTPLKIELQDTLFQAAHDIRGPLSALNMIANAMKNEGLDHNLIEFLEEAVSHINAIATEILNIKKEFHLNHLNSAIDFFDLTLFEKELTQTFSDNKRVLFTINIGPRENGKYIISGNLLQLHRIFRNLIQNSIDAKATTVSYESSLKGEWIQFNIKDNGTGFPAEFIGVVGKEGFTTRSEGNGLGLYYAVQNIERWGGKISFSNTSNGACIEIQLKILGKTK